ncbi:hypothetical protein F7Q99_36980 [Streptomyces kaniharaensis]|uniref:Uncharacterized protein n=1 Tax=Streptomyces kaniharaensis TaxID=212423 RepID=A0A6N7L470_9ACTN|nr:hypothetical protein [Streptomyces kaniharaensis]MQS17637.1 hypothetical protein [Streptomyces kaniharaensis]
MLRWAWHAYVDNHQPARRRRQQQRAALMAGRMTPEAELADVVQMIQTRLEQIAADPSMEELSPEIYAENVVKRLKDAFISMPLAYGVLAGLEPYLDCLTAPGYDPLRNLCDSVLKVAVASYRRNGIAVPDASDLRLRIYADWWPVPKTSSFPNPFLGMIWVEDRCDGACCQVADERKRAHLQTLCVTVTPAKFDADTLAALPIVLFHECVSHVLQGPLGPNRKMPDPNSSFAEGLMDRVALQVFEDALAGMPPYDQMPLLCYEHKSSFFTHIGRKLYQARHDEKGVSPEYEFAAAARAEGVEVADLLIHAFSRLRISDPLAAFLRLACALNVSDVPPVSRDLLVAELAWGLSPDAPESVQANILTALRRFTADQDVHALVDSSSTQ